jgi:hypothetical protein
MNQVDHFIDCFVFYYSKYYLGSHVELELKKFAERRTDIFGMGAQETVIGRKVSSKYIFFFSIQFFFLNSRLVKKIDVLTIKFNGMVIQQQVKSSLI